MRWWLRQRFGRGDDGTLEWVWRAGRWFARTWVHPRVIGGEHLPATGPVILAANHRGHADIPALVAALRRRIVFAATEDLWAVPVLGFVVESQGCPKVRHDGVDRTALEQCQRLLALDRVLGVFPEGELKPDGLEPFEEGAAYLSYRTGAPIVPVGIAGAADAWRHHTRWPIRSRQMALVVGPPLHADRDRRRREATRELNERLYTEIARLEALATRIRTRALRR